MKENIILIGFMGSGKSTLGRLIADSLDMTFIDTDEYIEDKEGMSISKIFELKGEKYFREVETKYIKEISEFGNTVVSTGGGVANSPTNMNFLKKKGLVFFLDCSIKCLVERLMESNTRPLLSGYEDLTKRITDLLSQRLDNYHRFMDYSISIDSESTPWESIEKIKKIYITKG